MKTFEENPDTGEAIKESLPYELVTARPSHDAWSLGVVVFQIITGQSLLLASSDDNIGKLKFKFKYCTQHLFI